MKSLIIVARRWFDKKNGNTYHSVSTFVDGKRGPQQGMTYGYGSAFEDTALELLKQKGFLPNEEIPGLRTYLDKQGIEFNVECINVGRKEDL